MKVSLTPKMGKNPGIELYGPHVTGVVWDIFNYALNSNRIDCPWYKAKQKTIAFFQGGADNRDGQWVYIEMWKPQESDEFIQLINLALSYVDDQGKPLPVVVQLGNDKVLKRIEAMCGFYEVNLEKNADHWVIHWEDALMLTSIVELGLVHPETFAPQQPA